LRGGPGEESPPSLRAYSLIAQAAGLPSNQSSSENKALLAAQIGAASAAGEISSFGSSPAFDQSHRIGSRVACRPIDASEGALRWSTNPKSPGTAFLGPGHFTDPATPASTGQLPTRFWAGLRETLNVCCILRELLAGAAERVERPVPWSLSSALQGP
jgi:hypothetical protein